LSRTSLTPRIALAIALLAGALALTAHPAPAAPTPAPSTVHGLKADMEEIEVRLAPERDGSTLGITLAHEGFDNMHLGGR
jgi:hypothetical protein